MSTPTGTSPSFHNAMKECAAAVDDALSRLLPVSPGVAESRLFEAMRYSALAGGKRLRPFLTLTVAAMFDVAASAAVRVAAAIEMVHTYSLIHDDLPCMDDGYLRRGVSTCHRRFDEATAVLAGDGLQARAFEILAQEQTHPDPQVRCSLVCGLAAAAGPDGMVGGQMIDMTTSTCGRGAGDVDAMRRMHRMKTGRLIVFSCLAAATLGQASSKGREALRAYADAVGLAFQIVDDVLDVEGNPEIMGKSGGHNQPIDKATYVTLLGLDQAKQCAADLVASSIASLRMFNNLADPLRDMAFYVVNRDR